MSKRPSPHDVVALLADIPSKHLVRGQVGTVVEALDEKTALVEFSDDNGEAYAIQPLGTFVAARAALRAGGGVGT